MLRYSKFAVAIMLLLGICLMCFGCSYKGFEDNIKESWDKFSLGEESEIVLSEVQPKVDTESAEEYEISTSFPWDSQITFAAVGESLSDYYELTSDGIDEIITSGTKGLEYTVQDVKIYQNFYETGISKSDIININEGDLSNSMFMLVDVLIEFSSNDTATKERITIDLDATTDMDSNGKVYPKIIYFSEHPTDSREADPIHQYFTMPSLVSGEESNIQIGILSQAEFVNEKRVFLTVGPFRPFGEANVRYFDLFSEERD